MAGREHSWKTTGAVLIGAAIVLLAVWKLRGSQEPPTPPPADETANAEQARSSTTNRPRLGDDGEPTTRAPAPRLDGTSATAIDMPPTMPMAQVLRKVPALMKAAAKPCFDPSKHPANSAERVTFRYTVEYAGGKGRISGVAPMDTNLSDEDLQNCILDRVEKLSWDAAGVPNRTSRRQSLSISVYDLSR